MNSIGSHDLSSGNSMKVSTEINEIMAALVKAQLEMKPAKKSGFNPHYKSHFATLEDIVEAAKPLLKNGIAITHVSCIEGGVHGLRVLMGHTSGQWISGFYPVVSVRNDPQGVGSAVTYARRYSYAPLAGVVTEDDDGEAASEPIGDSKKGLRSVTNKPPVISSARQGRYPSEKQISRLHAIAYANHWEGKEVKKIMKERFNIDSSKDLKMEQYEALCDFLQSNKPDEVSA